MTRLYTLKRPISPPPFNRSKRQRNGPQVQVPNPEQGPGRDKAITLAQVEAGKTNIQNHLDFFSEELSKSLAHGSTPLLSISDFQALYLRNQHAHGRHFVVHQHNHPVAGVHYDLRLQFSETSCISFAIPYGLPGEPNSRKPGRLAIETRVHNLWNNLVESASHATGSLLIWDTGEYSVLPRSQKQLDETSTDTDHEEAEDGTACQGRFLSEENVRLIDGFRSRYIRLRLHGSKLPKGYTVELRLPSANNYDRSARRHKRRGRRTKTATKQTQTDSTDLEDEIADADQNVMDVDFASDKEDEDDEREIAAKNAYPGAVNDIGSIHQRHWYMTLDKVSSGFVLSKHATAGKHWIRPTSDSDGDDTISGFESFYVMGAEVERSVVTGRTSDEIMRDEGIERFKARKMWMPIAI